MNHACKVEIVTDAIKLDSIVKLLDEVGVSGYSVIKDVIGKGTRGIRGDDGLTELFKNNYIMIVCNEKEMNTIVEAVCPIIHKFGGICIVSDVIQRIGRTQSNPPNPRD
ncbi:MAG: nitrogen regulatory protein [Candidatus Brocadiaceae bacterium]|nr:nitrogen regulatory protein [Candidatus Brocadiaceae bacterium]